MKLEQRQLIQNIPSLESHHPLRIWVHWPTLANTASVDGLEGEPSVEAERR